MSPRTSPVPRCLASLAAVLLVASLVAFAGLASLARAQEKADPAGKTPSPATGAKPASKPDGKEPEITPEQAQEAGRVLDDEVVARTKNKDPREVAQKIAGEYGGNADLILKDKKDAKVSWGGMMIAQELARTTGRPVSEILAQKKSGMGWGKIAKQHNAQLGDVMRSAGSRAQKLGLADETKMRERYHKWEAEQAKKAGQGKSKSATAPGVSSGASSGAAAPPAASAGKPEKEVDPVPQQDPAASGKSKGKGKSGK